MMKKRCQQDMNRETTIKALAEESGLLCSYLKLVIGGNLAVIGGFVLLALSAVLFPDYYVSHQNDSAAIAVTLLKDFSLGHAFTDAGQLHYLSVAAGFAAQSCTAGLSAFIFYSLLKIFQNVRAGESPFTQRTASIWGLCARVYGGITVLAFLSCFVFAASLLLIITPLVSYLFFHTLELIFLYGAALQKESDETL